jgi:hypothetical protein
MVHANGHAADNFKLLPCSIHQFTVNSFGEQAEQSVHAADSLKELFAWDGQVMSPYVGLEMLVDEIQAEVRNEAGDENFWLSHASEYNPSHVKNKTTELTPLFYLRIGKPDRLAFAHL